MATIAEQARFSGSSSLVGTKSVFKGMGKIEDKFPWKKINVTQFDYKKVKSRKKDIIPNKCRILAIPK